METATTSRVTVEATVNAPVEKVWEYWTTPTHIMKWNQASEDWHTTKSENDLRTGGTFSSRMEAKDGSFGFDFGGVYDDVKTNDTIAFTMGDGRKVDIKFTTNGNKTTIVETFDPENTHPVDFQKQGWQAIMNAFKKYTEEN
jgi:uncharacterized protein YndB with AHSA1/START domain